MFTKILIANRGEIACRIIRTAKRLGIRSVAIYSDVDAHAQHVKLADEAYWVGESPALESYLNQARILVIANEAKVEAIHPGYGFLSENPDFAEKCREKGIVFIGPSVEAMRAMGSKSAAKILMSQAGIPVVPGFCGENQQPEFLSKQAKKIGYPVLIKAVAGGGGKGMRIVFSEKDFAEHLAGAKREALKAFGDDAVLLEKYLTAPRHIEVQVFADQQGQMVHLFERDCSIQRRYQKIIEETPAVRFSEKLRRKMTECAVLAARTVNYTGAGTIEFLLDNDQFYFMEMNTRLQVEHPITEKITGIDLVEWQLRIAAGEPLPLTQSKISLHGHAIEARIYAEDPSKQFLPAVGSIFFLKTPEENDHIRLDSGIAVGDAVTTYYDPLLSKLIAYGENRSEALRYLQKGLADYQLVGVTTNRDFLQRIIQQPDFMEEKFTTHFIEAHLTELIAENPVSELAMMATAIYIVLNRQQQAKTAALNTQDPYSPWVLCDAWRLNSIAGQTLYFLCGEQRVDIRVVNLNSHFQVTLNEKIYSVTAALIEQGIFLSRLDREYSIPVVEYRDQFHLFLEDETAVIKFYTASYSEHKQHREACLTAPLPGTLIAVLVKEGERVEAGTNLAIIEAMKMEHTIRAQSAGVVKSWHFKVGDLVNEGEELLVFEIDQASYLESHNDSA